MKTEAILKRPEYTTAAKTGWRGYRRAVTVTATVTANDGKALLKRLMPAASCETHAELALVHVEAAKRNQRLWSSLVNRQMLKVFGRRFGIGDYKVSGICRDEFDEQAKQLLRKYVRNGQAHHSLAVIHKMAAGTSHNKAISFCAEQGL